MAPQATISKWGNSSGIRIPTSIVGNMNLELGDKLEFENHKIMSDHCSP